MGVMNRNDTAAGELEGEGGERGSRRKGCWVAGEEVRQGAGRLAALGLPGGKRRGRGERGWEEEERACRKGCGAGGGLAALGLPAG